MLGILKMTKPWTVVLAWILAGGNQSPRGGLKNDLLEVKKKKKVQLCVEYKKPLTNLRAHKARGRT